MSLDFLTLEEVLEIHDDQINRYGGASGIQDFGLLESALAQPQTIFGGSFLHTDLFEIAAAYFSTSFRFTLFFCKKKRPNFLTLNQTC